MANSIALRKEFITLLDKVYKNASLTSDLTTNDKLIKPGAQANELLIPMINMDGLGDYSRNDGYVNGNVDLTYQTITYDYDRGRKFSVDTQDNAESAEIAFGRLSGEFIRTKVVPEGDAYVFSSIAGVEGISKVAAGAVLEDGATVMSAIKVAVDKMDEDEVSEENRILYITPTNLSAIKALDTTKSRELLDGFSKIVKVPQSRFYTTIDLLDGKSTDEELGHYKKAAGGKDINFMIIQKSAIIKHDKHIAGNIIKAEDNQNADADIMKYRKYGVTKVYQNKKAGVYLHHKP